MSESLFPGGIVCVGLIAQIAALFFRGCRAGPLLLFAGGAFVVGFAVWEHDAVLLGGQIAITAALWTLARFRKQS